MNTTLAVVVSAIVILITALVVITIFSGGVNQIGSLTNARSICQTQAYSSCRSTNSMPLTWSIPSVSIPATTGTGNQLVACGGTELNLGKDCSAFGGTAVSGGTGAATYTCTNTAGQSCDSGAVCSATKTSGSGTCPSGQVCCKPPLTA